MVLFTWPIVVIDLQLKKSISVCATRQDVEAMKPDTLKGVAWKTITDKVKEIKPQVAPVVDNGNGAAGGGCGCN